MTDTNNTQPEPITPDPAAKARVIVGGILLPVAWIVAFAAVFAILLVLPPAAASAWGVLVILVGLLFALGATYAVVNGVIRGEAISFDRPVPGPPGPGRLFPGGREPSGPGHPRPATHPL